MLYLSDQCSPLQNMHFRDYLVGFCPLGAVEEYNESVYLELNPKLLPTRAEDKQDSLALSS